MVSRLSTISRKAGKVKNSFAPINKLPAETVILIATFFAKEHDLVDATAVCQRWRKILLSFPRLWCNVGGSSSKIQAYLERSQPMPIVVSLSSPELAKLIAPHTSRLVGLAFRVNDPLISFSRIGEYLRHPIPTLHTFHISADTPRLHTVEFIPPAYGYFFKYSKTLVAEGISSIGGYQISPAAPPVFPHVTDPTLCTNECVTIHIADLLDTFEHLPALERVCVTFRWGWYNHRDRRRTITLPHVQEMNIFTSRPQACIPPILQLIRLPNLTSLRFQIPSPLSMFVDPIFPTESFREHLPNLADLLELQVTVGPTANEVTFRNPTAMFSCVAGRLGAYYSKRVKWGAFPLISVRRMFVDVRDPRQDAEDGFVVGLIQDLADLEHLEFGGKCERVLQRFGHEMLRKGFAPRIKTLVVRAAGEHERREALSLERAKDALGLDMAITCIQDLDAQGQN
jgi:hypothetical protein